MFKKIFFMFFVFLIIIIQPKNSLASEYYSNLSQEEIKDIFELRLKDIPDPWTWIKDTQTYVIVEQNNGINKYWWNAPNMQMSIKNDLGNIIISSGYGPGIGIPAKNNKCLINLGNSLDAKTAYKKYGFKIPIPTYMGERPLVNISVSGVLLPDNAVNFFGRVFNTIFEGEVVGTPTDKDLSSLTYLSPRDYNSNEITFDFWVKNNWYKAMDNIKDNQILLTSADQSTGKDSNGEFWVKKTIINDNGLNKPGLTEEEICNKLKDVTGENYADVAKNIVLSSGIIANNKIQRMMPYDLSRMNPKDLELFNGVRDPRSEIQSKLYGTGYDNAFFNAFKSKVINFSGKLSEISIALNGFANFSFLESIGFDPTEIWYNNIMKLVTLVMMCCFVFYVTKSAFSILLNKGNRYTVISKLLSSLLIVAIVIGVTGNKTETYNFIKNTYTSFSNISNITLQQNDNLSALYGEGNAIEKENTALWFPYFNMWTNYQTGNSIIDNRQIINTDSNDPEMNGLTIPKIGNVQQTIWSTVLADSFTKDKVYSGDIYRTVDHFMAPRLKSISLENGKINNIKMETNNNYNGRIQSKLDFSTIFFQIMLIFLIILKVCLFFEFIFNIAFLLFSLALSAIDNSKIKFILKELLASMFNVLFLNLIIFMVVFTTLIVSGITSFIIFVFYCYIIFNILKSIINSSSVFTPKFLRPIQKGFNYTKRIFER